MNHSPANPTPVCIVTGGSSGIGLATSSRFAEEGYRVAICSRDEGRLQAAVHQLQDSLGGAAEVLHYAADVGRPEQVRQFIDFVRKKYGRIDVLVNSAGTAPRAAIDEMPLDDLWRALDVNVVSVFTTIQAVWPTMKSQGRGTIVNVSSLATTEPLPGLGLYGSCKSWVESFTRAAAAEGKPHDISVFAVRPGAVETPMLRGLFPDFPAENALTPSAVAGVILQLCSGHFVDCTGQVIEVKK